MADKVQSEFHPSSLALVAVCLAVINRDAHDTHTQKIRALNVFYKQAPLLVIMCLAQDLDAYL